MAGFLYYLPDASGRRANDFIAARGRVFTGLEMARRGCIGPDQQQGTLLIPQVKHPPQPRYAPQEQAWRAIPGQGWGLGYETANPPGPDDLIRRNAIPLSHVVQLGDGRAWRIPVARFISGDTGLPQSLDLGPDGNLTPVPDERYARLWERATSFWERVIAAMEKRAAGGDPPELREDWNTAIEALNANYHLDMEEVGVLRLLTTVSAIKVLQALVDLPSLETLLEAAEKKTSTGAGDGSNTGSGAMDSAPVTDPPAPILRPI